MILTGVTILFIAGFLFVMGLIMLDELLVATGDSSSSTANESMTSNITDTYQLDIGYCGLNELSVTSMIDTHSGANIDLENVSTNGRTGEIKYIGTSAAWPNSSSWNVSYIYKYSNSEACLATNKTITGQGEFGGYVDLIVLAIVITVIVSLILIGFAMRRVQ